MALYLHGQRGEAAHVDRMYAHRARRLDLVVGEATPPFLEHHAAFETRERRTEAEVHAAAEREALLRVAADIVLIGALEHTLVAISGAHEQQRAFARAERLAVQLDVARDPAREHLRGVVEAQRLLDPARDAGFGRLAHERALLGVAPH